MASPNVVDEPEAISLDDAPVGTGPRQAWVRQNAHALRSRAAQIAVDMESGAFVDSRTGEHWPHGQPYSRARIAVEMGASAGTHETVSFMKGSAFQRAVEWERVRREASYRMSILDSRPILRVVNSALMLELCRRALEEPESFKNSEILEATRKYWTLLGQAEGGGAAPKDVRTTVNVFLQQVRLLPEDAQAKAMGLFRHELDSLAALAKQVGGPSVNVTVVPRKRLDA